MNKYSASDCIALYRVWLKEGDHQLNFYEEVVSPIKHLMQNTVPTDREVNTILFSFLKTEYRKDRLESVRNFVFDVPFEDVPLYVNDKNVQVFLKWRLTIGK